MGRRSRSGRSTVGCSPRKTRLPVDEVVDQVREYVDTAREAINDVVKDELNDLRKAVRRQRKRIGI
jgi:hypothetical protein